MQIFGLHKNIYRLARWASTQELLDKQTLERKKIFDNWQLLKSKGVADCDIAIVTGISRATYYRRKAAVTKYGISGFKARSKRPANFRKSKVPLDVINLIINLRRDNPTYGKAKIAVILKRDHQISYSESTVGRVLSNMIAIGKLKCSITSVKCKRKRRFERHAKSWKYNMKAVQPGEMVQIDHMTVTKNNIVLKHFQAWDPITKVIVGDAATNATSIAAAKFLEKVIKEMPFAIKSIQVDGGSEFMRDFEQMCEKLGIELYVLPPKKPQYNGGVERSNRTFREEFYAQKIGAESIGAFRYELQRAVQKYNSYRPHFNLKGLTPFEYTNQILAA